MQRNKRDASPCKVLDMLTLLVQCCLELVMFATRQCAANKLDAMYQGAMPPCLRWATNLQCASCCSAQFKSLIPSCLWERDTETMESSPCLGHRVIGCFTEGGM